MMELHRYAGHKYIHATRRAGRIGCAPDPPNAVRHRFPDHPPRLMSSVCCMATAWRIQAS